MQQYGASSSRSVFSVFSICIGRSDELLAILDTKIAKSCYSLLQYGYCSVPDFLNRWGLCCVILSVLRKLFATFI